jgi:hypothetical protein
MAKSKSEAADKIVEAVRELVVEESKVDHRAADKAARERLKNTDGKMLMCSLVLHKRPGAPDPQVFTIGEQIFWIKRGATVTVPWYLVAHMKNNSERKFKQEKDPVTGKNIVTHDDMLSEPFSYQPINPAPGVEV